MVRLLIFVFLLTSLQAFAQDTIPVRWELSFSGGISNPLGAYRKTNPDWGQPPYQISFFDYEQLQKRGNSAAERGNYFQLELAFRVKKGLAFWTAYRYTQNSVDVEGFSEILRRLENGFTINRSSVDNFILSSQLTSRNYRFIHKDYQIHTGLIGYSYTFGLDRKVEFTLKQGLGHGRISNLDYQMIPPTVQPSRFNHQPLRPSASSLMVFFGGKLGLRLKSNVVLGLDASFLHGNFPFEQRITYSVGDVDSIIDDSINFRTLNMGTSLSFRF